MSISFCRFLSKSSIACIFLYTISAPVQAASVISVVSGPQDSAHHLELISDPSCCQPAEAGFALHDHGYIASYIPDPSRAYVTFEFDSPVLVNGISMIQHHNGITKIEHYVGSYPTPLVTSGVAWSSFGDVTSPAAGTALPEMGADTFTFTGPSTGGNFHTFIIAKTSNPVGWASYRWYLDVQAIPVPELSTSSLLIAGLALLALGKRRRVV